MTLPKKPITIDGVNFHDSSPGGLTRLSSTNKYRTGSKPKFTAVKPGTTATTGVRYAFQFKASGSPAPAFSKAAGSLPTGLKLTSKGLLSGTPTKASTTPVKFKVKAKNAAGSVTSSYLSITVRAKPKLTAASPRSSIEQHLPYSYRFTASGSPAPTFSKTSGALPTGMTLASDGRLTGTPSTGGDFTFTVRAQNAAGSVSTTKTIRVRDLFGPIGSSRVLSRGDLNGDGYTDLAIGVPGENLGTTVNAGQVNIVLGGPSGLNRSTGFAISQASSAGETESIGSGAGAAESGDHWGAAVAFGDVNGDGYDDLAVGAPGEDVKGVVDAGQVDLLLGSASGLKLATPISLAQATGGTSNGLGTSAPAERGDFLGTSLAFGDTNHDGYDDIAIGVAGEDIGDVVNAGAVMVVRGAAGGTTLTGLLGLRQHSNGTSGGLGTDGVGAEPGDILGTSVAFGDFDHDGYADLAIGVPGEGLYSEDRAGGVQVVYGTASGLTDSRAQFRFLITDSNGDSHGFGAGGGSALQDDYLGAALATGDLNGDGYDDLAVGVPGKDTDTQEGIGQVNLLLGSPSGITTTGTKRLRQKNGTTLEGLGTAGGGAENGDIVGAALAIGDIDGDGYDDLAIGTFGEDLGDIVDAGIVNLVYGSANLDTDARGKPLYGTTESGAHGLSGAAEAGDRLGSALVVGDWNGDGRADLAVGVPYEDVGTIVDAGAITVAYGATGGISSTGTIVSHQMTGDVSQGLGTRGGKAETSDYLGGGHTSQTTW